MFLKISENVPQRIVSRMEVLKNGLAKVGKISFAVYLGMLVFTFVVVGITSFVVSFAILSFFLPLFQTIGGAVLVAVLASFVSVGVIYLFAIIQISSRSRKIDANLPLIANFMSVLANSGMPPERILRSLGNVGDEFGVGEEIRRAVGDVELLGMDLTGALRNASKRSSSRKFASMINGFITTAHMGGDLAAFLREKANIYKKSRRLSMKGFLENLSNIAELYVSLMIALPLTLVIMLSVMSFIGGGATLFGNVEPYVILMILTFIITPAGVGILLLMVDSLTPPR